MILKVFVPALIILYIGFAEQYWLLNLHRTLFSVATKCVCSEYIMYFIVLLINFYIFFVELVTEIDK